MEKLLSADGEEITAFDLVELIESHESRESGTRGTVILIGIRDVLVDFAWIDHHEHPPRTASHLGLVPAERLRILERRTFTGTGMETAD